jgi:competence protein ComEC
MPFATQRTKVIIEGTVLEPIRVINNMARLRVKADLLFVEDKTVPVNDNIFVSIYNHIPSVRPGERIRFPARLRPFKNFNNPGRYDYESAMRLKGFTCAASASDGRRIVPMGPGHLSFPRGLIERIQRPVRDFFSKRLNDQDYALFRALILGERQGINQELRELFNQTGLGHVLAVSGLHIGLVAWMTFFLFKWTLSRSYNLPLKTDLLRITALLTCLPVIGYTFLAGYQISGQRAMTMLVSDFPTGKRCLVHPCICCFSHPDNRPPCHLQYILPAFVLSGDRYSLAGTSSLKQNSFSFRDNTNKKHHL